MISDVFLEVYIHGNMEYYWKETVHRYMCCMSLTKLDDEYEICNLLEVVKIIS